MLRFDLSLSALQANQIALQTTAHNISNAETPGYTRQDASLQARKPAQVPGLGYIGQGVDVATINRKADAFLDERIQQSNQVMGQLNTEQRWLEEIEATIAPSQGDLISAIEEFVENFHASAAAPEDISLRSILSESAGYIGDTYRDMADHFESIREGLHDSLKDNVAQVNNLIRNIAELNERIINDRQMTVSNDMLDQRDQALKELSEKVPVLVHYNDKGSAQVIMNNRMLVEDSFYNQLEVNRESEEVLTIRYAGSSDDLNITEGTIGGLLNVQDQYLPDYQNKLDSMAQEFVSNINQAHIFGVNRDGGIDSVLSEESVEDPTATLDSENLGIVSGDLTFSVRDLTNDSTIDTTIAIDPAVDSLDDVAARINANIGNVSASVNADNRLLIESTDSNHSFIFSADSSDFLAKMGVNTLFSGTEAKNMSLSSHIRNDVSRLALGKSYAAGNNENALQMIDIVQNQSNANLDNMTYHEYWESAISEIGADVNIKQNHATLQTELLGGLEERKQSVSGVNLDEELVNMKKYQHAYEAGARLFQVVNSLMDTVINLGQ